MKDKISLAVLIPAFNPDERIVGLLHSLRHGEFDNIIVVDDGSAHLKKNIFDRISQCPEVTLLRHPVNRGKGAALKTGLDFIIHQTDIEYIITADSDGQHAPADIAKVKKALLENPTALVLGTRMFTLKAPLRNLLGNKITRWVFHLLSKQKVTDTQTGLRGFSRKHLPLLLNCEGTRYEYEMNVLYTWVKCQLPVIEIPIQAIYMENNRNSHFLPIRDSLKIYSNLFRLRLQK